MMSYADQNDFVTGLISSKLVGFREIVVCLFENCNLSCVFCPQKHDAVVGMSHDEILLKTEKIIRYINESDNDGVHIQVMGGELFQDHLIEKGFVAFYEEFMHKIRQGVKNPDRVGFNFITNLVIKNIDAVKSFCERNNLKISISYDPSGRFSKENLQIFVKNTEVMSNYIRMVSCVITKPNIDRILDGDPIYDMLYSSHDTDWDPLLPSLSNSSYLMPKESELLIFLKFLVDRYPKCINLENFFSSQAQLKMRCTRGRSLTLMSDNSIPQGCSGSIFLKEAKTKNLGGQEIVSNYLQKYNCLSCEYYAKCPFTCFIKQDYKKLVDDVSECVYKSVYKYIDRKIAQKVSHVNP